MEPLLGTTLAFLIGSLLWSCYSIIKHMFYSNIQNTRYRIGVCSALILYIIGETFFLIYQFDGMKSTIFVFHVIFALVVFPIAITIDTLILLIFRVLNPKIPEKLIKIICLGTWVLYFITPFLSGYAYLSNQPSKQVVEWAKTFRFTIAVWYGIYHDAVFGYLIHLVYKNVRKKANTKVSKALKSALYLLVLIFTFSVLGLAVYGNALMLNDTHPLRFVFLNITNGTLGVLMNLLVYLFLFLTKLQFSDRKELQQGVISPGKIEKTLPVDS